MYYGNADAADAQSPEDVWSAYARVWHLNGDRVDSASSTDLAGTAADGTGIVGGGAEFSDAAHALQEDPAGIGPGFFETGATLSVWIRPTTWGESNFGRIAEVASGFDAAGGWSLIVAQPDAGVRFTRGHDGTAGIWAYPNTVELDAWSHIVMSYDDSANTTPPAVRANGVVVDADVTVAPGGAVTTSATEPVTLGKGAFSGATRNFEGTIDEVRLRSEVSSARWQEAERTSVLGLMTAAIGAENAPDGC
jgi:hypothetical protein